MHCGKHPNQTNVLYFLRDYRVCDIPSDYYWWCYKFTTLFTSYFAKQL